jgi:DNA-binding SARP family transcriptional activator
MPRLVVRLLGGYRVELDGEAVYGFETDKARALLAFLMVEANRPHRRETLAGLLWPDRPDTIARANLRQALSAVRRALADYQPPPFLFVTSTDVQFNAASDYTLDVAELETFAVSPALHRQLLAEDLCTDFLAGFAVPDSEAFQAWVLNKQEYYHRLALEILDEQNTYFEANGDYEQAVAAARCQLQLEPWLEEAHRDCMRGLALAGRRDEALHQYELCRRALDTELSVRPAESTQALYAEIQAGRFTGSPRGPAESHTDRAAPPVPAQAAPSLVAREDELGRLAHHLELALAGETGVVFVSGDAGSGKSALLEAFAASAMAEDPGLLVAAVRCNPGGSLDPCAPLCRIAEMLFGDLASDAAWRLHNREQVERLRRATALTLASLKEHGPDLIDTLVPASAIAARAGAQFAIPKAARTPGTSPSQSTLFDQLLSTLAAISRKQPLLILLDDLHWVDDASADFLLHIGRELSRSRVLILGAYRSATVSLGRRDPRSGEVSRHPIAIAINELRRSQGDILVELDRADGRAFVEAFIDTEPNRLGKGFRDALYAQTGGHALFTVEMLRNLQGHGKLVRDEAGRWLAPRSLDWGSLPARVEAVIAERIERLPETCHRLLSCASVLGDDFSGEAVAELMAMPVGETLACLSGSLARQHHLVRAEGLQRLGNEQRSMYRFTHHLFQKYLYDQLDPVERSQLHATVAASLDRQAGSNPAEREPLAARLAWHYEMGGLPLQAARALYDAGRQAMRVSAYRDALNRFDHGLALLEAVPPSRERAEIACLLELTRLGPQRNLEWITSDAQLAALARATDTWAKEAEGRPKLLLLWAQAERLVGSGHFDEALAMIGQLCEGAARWGEEDFTNLADVYAGMTYHYMGNLAASETALDRVRAWLTPERAARLRTAIGMDMCVNALALSALNLWFLGHGNAALARSREALAAARAGGTAVGRAAAAGFGANLLFFLRNDSRTEAELSRECHQMCAEHGLGMLGVFADVIVGRVMVMQAIDASADASAQANAAAAIMAGIDHMRSESWRGSGMVIGVDFFVVVLADTCLLVASGCAPDDTLRATLLAKGLAGIDSVLGPGGMPCGLLYQPEMHRLRGELLLARDGLAAAEEAAACFERGLAAGQRQAALAWELRAAMSLVRLAARQGARRAVELTAARHSLAAIYARFTEGFAFPDLQEATALVRSPVIPSIPST